MTFIEKIISFFRNRKFRELIQKGRQFSRDFVSINKAKSIGIIVNANQCSVEDLKELRGYIEDMKSKGKYVVVFELNYMKKSVPNFQHSVTSVFISPEKYNWFGCPKSAIESQIIQHNLDILLNCDTSGSVTSHYVCGMANAKTRTGPHIEGMESCYELMVEAPKEARIKKIILNFEHFLKMVEK